MKIKIGLAGAAMLALALIGSAAAKTKNPLQPPPPAVPVGDVDAQPLEAPIPPKLEGTGQAIDGDEIAIGDVIFQLDGIAAPLMTVPMGPEARVALRMLAPRCTANIAETMLAGGMAAVYRQTTSQNAEERERAARYDAAETEARGRNLGLWNKPTSEDGKIEQAKPALDADLLRGWLMQIPIVAALAIAGLIALVMSSLRDRAENKAVEAEMQALLAILLGEVLAMRASAQAAFNGTANLIQDLPIPTAQLASIALPPMTVFEANADKLSILPREVSVDMVQFHARHKIVAKVLSQASTLRCEQLRAAFEALVEAADEPMQRAEKLLG